MYLLIQTTCSDCNIMWFTVTLFLNVCIAIILLTAVLFDQTEGSIVWSEDAVLIDGDIFDFIIVGAGSAGAVLANRLTEVKDWKCLLIEAGGDPPIASVVPALLSELINTKYDWNYYSVNDNVTAQAQKIPGRIPLTRGKMLGGCSSINAMMYVRGNKEDYNEWDRDGFTGWNWNNVLPYFLKSEGLQDKLLSENPVYGPFHNTKGPIKVTKQRSLDPNVENKLNILLDSMNEIGIKRVLDYNGPNQFGISRAYLTQSKPPGVRSSTAQAFLAPIRNRCNLFVLKNAYATKVLMNKESAFGVEVLSKNTKLRFFAKKEIIVSAGAINTPKLLIASGIGHLEDLNPLGVDIISDLPVGHDLQDHLLLPIMFTGAPTFYLENNMSSTFSLDYYPLPTTQGFFSVFDEKRPEIQLTAFYFNQTSPLTLPTLSTILTYNDDVANSVFEENKKYEIFLVDIVLLHPKSKGKVNIKSLDPSSDPEVNLGYLSDKRDLVVLREGIKKTLNLTQSTYFKGVKSKVIKVKLPQCDKFQFLSDRYWDCYTINMARTLWHQAGTCAMGKVVDTNLNVIGVDKLRVVDASVLPTMPSGNPNAPVIMIAEKIADVIKNNYHF